ncbi:MAG: hypothetical protein IKJ24_03195 [Clostridia bacterium]|nr:hypothetical protein [Clostridia bacterium]
MKKRIIALLLCLVMTVSVFAGCAGSIDADSDYKGEQIMMYLSEDIYNLDPAYAYKNAAMTSIVSLIFDTLFTVDSTGKVSPSLAKSYRTEEKDGSFFMYIEINEEAKWSDNNPVTADDVVYAWKRVLNPKNSFEAAALLFDIKGAREYNLTGEGKDAMGISADQKLLTIEFEGKIDVDQFILNLTSLALAPLREDIVGEMKDNDKQADDWAKKPSIMVASGPFKLTKVGYYTNGAVEYLDVNYSDKKVDANNKIILDKNGNPVFIDGTEEKKFAEQKISSYMLERNLYYYRNAEDGEKLDVSVVPYRIIVDCSLTDEEILQAYRDGIITYVGDIPMSLRSDVEAEAKTYNSLSTNACYLNQKALVTRTLADGSTESVALFANETVRQVLSMAIDRETIAGQLVFAEAATGLVPTGVYDTNSVKKLFRDTATAYEYLAKKEVAALKATLAEADIVPSEYSFSITVAAYDEAHCAVADALCAAWGEEGLGFKVTLNKRGTVANNDVHKDVAGVPSDLCDDLWAEDLAHLDYQAAVLDLVAISADPFSVLAPFATTFSGQAVDMSSSDEPQHSTHITGYNSAEYDALIEAIFAEKTIENRSENLHKAEAQLMEDMPVIPIVFNQSAYLINEDILDLGNKILFWDKASEYYAPINFDKASINNYEDYELACAKYVADNFEKWQANPTSYFALSFGEASFASFAHTNSNYFYLFKGKYGTEGYEFIPAKPAKDAATEAETSAN